MKIPRYEQQIGVPNPPQITQIADVRNDNLSGVANSLKELYDIKLKEQEEAKKTAIFQADTSIKMAMSKAMFDLEERIKNGGSYANAEAEYQKAHDKAIADFGSAFDVDESGNTKARALAEYQADGLNNILRIRQSAASRRRSDTAASADLRAEQLRQQLVDAKTPEEANAARQQITSLYASATASIGDSPDVGKLKAIKSIQAAEQDRFQLFAQNNVNNPKAVLDQAETLYKDRLIDTDFYIQARGNAMESIQKLGSVDLFLAYAKDPASAPAPTQQSTDVFFSEKLLKPFQNNEISQIDYETGVVDTVKISGKIPSQLENQMKTIFSIYKEGMSAEYKSAVVSNARLVSKMYDTSPYVFTKDGAGLNKRDVVLSQTIVNRIDAGVPEDIAVDETLKIASDKNYDNAYEQAVKKSYEDSDLKKHFVSKLNIDEVSWPAIQSKATDLYAMSKAMGASDGDAKDNAVKYLSKQYGEFDGVLVKYPPYQVTNIQDKDQWLRLAQKELNNFYESEFPNQVSGTTAAKKFGKAILAGDEQTKMELESNKNPSFVLHYQTQEGAVVPVFDKNGQKVRIAGEPIKQTNIIRPAFSSKLFGGTFIGPVKLGGYTPEELKALEAGIKEEKSRMRGELK